MPEGWAALRKGLNGLGSNLVVKYRFRALLQGSLWRTPCRQGAPFIARAYSISFWLTAQGVRSLWRAPCRQGANAGMACSWYGAPSDAGCVVGMMAALWVCWLRCGYDGCVVGMMAALWV